jgi:phosphotriesterase-related protein
MVKVPSIRGDIDPASLGVTLMHEHLFVLSPEINQKYPETWGDEDVRVKDAVRQLHALKSGGVDSLVDMTVLGQGRYIPRIQRIADQVDIKILVATGIYACGELPPFFQSRYSSVARMFRKLWSLCLSGISVKVSPELESVRLFSSTQPILED